MYCSQFGIQRLPFNNTPDPTFYYSTPDHEEALATLQYATQQRKGFVLVTGEIGAGKTLIGRIFLRQIDANSTTAVISQTNLTGRQLLAAICTEFGLAAPPEASTLDLTQRLQDYLVEQFARNRYVVVLLDEAQNLPDESFEELRMLGNLEADDAKLLQVCILGQPELRDRFRQANMKQLDQRLFRRFHLPSLNRQQTGEYITHRLAVAACKDAELFSREAIERIYHASGGVPRLINQICDNALLTAYGQEKTRVDARIIDLVLERDQALITPASLTFPSSTHKPGPLQTAKAFGEESLDCEANRLAALAIEQTRDLREEVSALEATPDVLSERVGKIAGRQNELQKIVSGATTRWLAAKDKLEEYRSEIQAEIREVIVRCHKTQEHLQQLERTAAPAEDLDEIRETHMRETQRLTKLMQSQRDGLAIQLQQAEQRWSTSEQELRQLVGQSRNDEQLRQVQSECEAATREVLGTLDRHRQGMLDSINALRQQCEGAHRQLRDAEASFERRCAEGERRLEQLRSDGSRHHQQLATLRDEIESWRGEIQRGLKTVQDQAVERTSPAQIKKLREEQAAAAEILVHRCEAQEASLIAFRRGLEESMARTDRLQRGQIEQLVAQAAQQESTLQELRGRLQTDNRVLNERFEQLAEQFSEQSRQLAESRIAHEELEKVRDEQARVLKIIVKQLNEGRESLRKQRDAVGERCRELQAGVDQLNADKAGVVDVEFLRQQCAEDSRRVSETMAAQERELSELAQRVSDQAEQVSKRIDVLSQLSARREDVEVLSAELHQQSGCLAAELQKYQRESTQALMAVQSRVEQSTAQLAQLSNELATRHEMEVVQKAQVLLADQIETVRDISARNDSQLAQRIFEEKQERETAVTQLTGQVQSLSDSVKEVAREAAPVESVARVEEALTTSVADLREQIVSASTEHTSNLRHLVERLSDTSSRVNELEKDESRCQITLQPDILSNLGSLVSSAQKERTGLTETLERAGAITSHFRNCSSQLQEVMDEWMSSAGSVREQSEGLRSSAASARGILDAMLKCNAALETKLKSTRWRSELDQGEAVASRLDRSASAAMAAAERLAPLLNALEAARGDAETWERRQKQAAEVTDRFARLMNGAQSTLMQLKQTHEASQHLTTLIAQAQGVLQQLTDVSEKKNGLSSLIAQARATGTNLIQATDKADRLSRLISQAHAVGNHLEKSIDSRQRLIAAMAQNTSQLVDVLQTARLADESDRPTPAGGSRGVEKSISAAVTSPSRINWPTLHAPLAAK